jgi:hypothetical protein
MSGRRWQISLHEAYPVRHFDTASNPVQSVQLVDERGIVGKKVPAYCSWSSTFESRFFQLADRRRMEVDIVQDKTSLSPELERLDNANGKRRRRLWQSEIRRCRRFRSHDLMLLSHTAYQ